MELCSTSSSATRINSIAHVRRPHRPWRRSQNVAANRTTGVGRTRASEVSEGFVPNWNVDTYFDVPIVGDTKRAA